MHRSSGNHNIGNPNGLAGCSQSVMDLTSEASNAFGHIADDDIRQIGNELLEMLWSSGSIITADNLHDRHGGHGQARVLANVGRCMPNFGFILSPQNL